MDCPDYVIGYESQGDFVPLPQYMPDSMYEQSRNQVTAYLVDQGVEVGSFTDLMNLNVHLPEEDT